MFRLSDQLPMVRQLILPLCWAVIFISSFQAFGNSGVTYHGRLLKPDGSPVISSVVQFRLQIRTPGTEDCLLYEEIQNLDLSSSAFSSNKTREAEMARRRDERELQDREYRESLARDEAKETERRMKIRTITLVYGFLCEVNRGDCQ